MLAFFSDNDTCPVDMDRLQTAAMNGETSVVHSLSNHVGQGFSDDCLFEADDMTLMTSSGLIVENSLK